MTTTVVRDSIVGDQWIYNTAQSVPIQRVLDKDGNPNGDILTGPVRLAFDNLFELPKATEQMNNPKYGASLLFTPYADFNILYEEFYAVCAREFADYYDASSGQYHGLYSPFRDQAEKIKFGGFTPGCVFLSCTSKYQPPVVDTRHNPIVDRSKVYPGVWAICSISPYAFKDPRKKGVAFGLQSVMIIGDDQKFGGGAPDPKQTFSGVNVQAPIVRPETAQGMPGAAQQPQPAGIPGYTQTAPAQPPAAAPAVPQQNYQMPGTPAPAQPAQPGAQPAMPPQGGDDWSFMD